MTDLQVLCELQSTWKIGYSFALVGRTLKLCESGISSTEILLGIRCTPPSWVLVNVEGLVEAQECTSAPVRFGEKQKAADCL